MPIVDFLKTWRMRLRNIPELADYNEAGMGTSYPVFAHEGNQTYIRHFYHVADPVGPRTIRISTPGHLAIMRLDDFSLVSVGPAGFPLKASSYADYTFTANQNRERRPLIVALESMYDHLLTTYPNPPTLDLVDDFAAKLRLVALPLLIPYYDLLLQDFRHWAGSNTIR